MQTVFIGRAGGRDQAGKRPSGLARGEGKQRRKSELPWTGV